MTQPFNIGSSDIKRLNDIQLTQLLKELLHSETNKFGISQRSTEVALNIRVGDGGEDGRVNWCGGPSETDYIPHRFTMFQNKATEMDVRAYGREIMTKARKGQPSTVKPKVDEVLSQGGSYVIFTTQELNSEQKGRRINEIRGRLRDAGKEYCAICDIKIYDAAQIAGWVNRFVSTIVSVQNWAGRPIVRGLKNFQLWSEYDDLSWFPFVNVDSRKEILTSLSKELIVPKSCFRIVGLSGLGKTRTAFQVFKQNDDLKSLVIYVDATYAPDIDALVADWVSLGLKAVIVVDNCEYQQHRSLAKEVRRESSQISLLTLDYNFESVGQSTNVFKLCAMTNLEIINLLKPTYEGRLPDLDRVASFAQGFPQMAVLLAEARLSDDPRIGELTEDDLAHKLLWGRNEQETPEKIQILQACSLFDAFGVAVSPLVRVSTLCAGRVNLYQ